MTYHKCDWKKCGKEFVSELQIQIRGYKPVHHGGILLPEQFHSHEFCSHDCFESWMKEVLQENEALV